MFRAEIRKIMYTPVNPSFTTQKWGLRGSNLYRHVFVMWGDNLHEISKTIFLKKKQKTKKKKKKNNNKKTKQNKKTTTKKKTSVC